MGRASRLYVRVIKRTFGCRFALARMTRAPLLGMVLRKTFFDGDGLMMLPKDAVAAGLARRAMTVGTSISVEPQDVVLPSKVVEEFIKRAEDHFVMDFCICRESSKCKDYPRELGCLFLGKAVRKIDRKLGRPVSAQEALEHVRKCRDAGLVHLIGRNKLDSIWLSAGPKEELMTICSCCPCCCLWKMLPDLSHEINDRVVRMPGVQVGIDPSLCTGCGKCTEGACFVDALSMADGKARMDQDRCRGCGRCVEACPAGAIRLDISDRAYVDSAVKRLEGFVRLNSVEEKTG
jgi:ferredoxin